MSDAISITKALKGEWRGSYGVCHCPCHDDRQSSLSVKDGNTRLLVKCHAGCDPVSVLHKLRDMGLLNDRLVTTPSRANPPESSREDSKRAGKVERIYPYHSASGEILFEVARFTPKGFRQRCPDGKGGHLYKLDGVERVPYRLPELLEAVANEQTIFIAEGEKAVDALVSIGVVATCSPGGAGKWRDSYSRHLKGADVVILPDNDEPGRQHAEQVKKSLDGIASSIKALRLPDLPDKGDAFDWIAQGGTAEELWSLVEVTNQRFENIKDSSTEAQTSVKPEVGLVSRCAAEIDLEPVEWIWPGRIARGKHTSVGGDPGGGKSNVGMFIAAKVSVGGEWPCGEGRAPQGSVLVLSAEDGAGDTIVPRLHAAEADCGRIHIISAVRTPESSRGFNLQADIALLEKKIKEIGDVALIIIDPVSSYLGKTDSHKNAEVRGVLEPLSAMAERTRVAVLSITHFSKAGTATGAKALHRFIGSIAFVGAPRMAFAVIEDADDKDRRLVLHAKNNLAAPPQGLAFRLNQTIVGPDGQGIVASRVDWEADPVTITANEALAAETSGTAARPSEEAEAFLRELLADGPVSAKQVKSDTDDAGFSWATIRRAKERIGIRHSKERGDARGGWLWSLRDATCSHIESEQVAQVEHLQGKPRGSGRSAEHLPPTGEHLQKTAENLEGAQGAQLLNVSTFGASEHLRSKGEAA